MELGLKDKPVLVMASSGGIGRGTALEFAREGARVMLFARSEEKLIKTQQEIASETGNKPLYTVGDISNPDDITNVIDRTVVEFGSLWALFNNTGGPPAGTFDSFDNDEAWQSAFELTLLSYIRVIRTVLPHMRKSGEGGRIVNNTSISTKRVIDNLILSNTFRMGIVGLSKTLARELGPENILVNVVGPGRIDTDRIAHLDSVVAEKQSLSAEQVRAAAEANIPLGRAGRPEEFGKIVAFLCSEANTYLTGQNLIVDGGAVDAY
ncbi:MAG: SDR family oxidoreductase [Verrucomicrobia bacterium]|nr:SDR family oxidoreductase [Verrucomicrobiota bacterium]